MQYTAYRYEMYKVSEFTFSKVPELVLRSLGNATSKKLTKKIITYYST